MKIYLSLLILFSMSITAQDSDLCDMYPEGFKKNECYKKEARFKELELDIEENLRERTGDFADFRKEIFNKKFESSGGNVWLIFSKNKYLGGQLEAKFEDGNRPLPFAGAWEFNSNMIEQESVGIILYSDTMKCSYKITKKGAFYWFSNIYRNYNNICSDRLMARVDGDFEIVKED